MLVFFRTYSVFILARPQKAPSVSLLMLFLCSLSTSRLDRLWKVRPSTWRIRFLFSSLRRTECDQIAEIRKWSWEWGSGEALCHTSSCHNKAGSKRKASCSVDQGSVLPSFCSTIHHNVVKTKETYMLHFIVQKTPALKGTVHPPSVQHHINKGSGHILSSIKFSQFQRVKEF